MTGGATEPFERIERFTAPAKPTANGELSAANRDFFRFVESHPEYLDSERFDALYKKRALTQYPLQPWPTFVGPRVIEEAARTNDRVCALVKSVPERLFDNHPERLAEYFGLDSRYAALLVALLRRPGHLEGLVARGDYVRTEAGFRCLEVNFGGNLGGWQCSVWAKLYDSEPLFRRFLEETGRSYEHRHPSHVFFGHLLEMARRAGPLDEGVLRVAFLVPEEHRTGGDSVVFAARALDATLAEIAPDLDGETVVCEAGDLAAGPDGLLHQGRRVHAVSEPTFGRTPGVVVRQILKSAVDVYNGPTRDLFVDKRTLALLSEHQESDRFDREERETIAAAVPWTREVREGETAWEGERRPLTEILEIHRERLVLKPAVASQGHGVTLGRRQPPEAWRAAVATALAAPEPWIVQEHEESLPYLYLDSERGPCAHHVTWGLFAFGRRYGGGFLRLMPKEGTSGIVNAAQGATQGVIMESAD